MAIDPRVQSTSTPEPHLPHLKVASAAAGIKADVTKTNGSTFVPRYAERMELVKPSAIRQLLALGNDPSVISFGGGFPDSSLFPVEEIARCYAAALAQTGQEALQYSATQGILSLREEIVKLMQRDAMDVHVDEICVLQGSQQGLDLVGKLLLGKGDKVIVENPTFLGGLAAFNPYQPTYLSVDSDLEGLDTVALEKLLQQHPNDVKFLYVVSDHNNPTGISMSLRRRQHLVQLAKQYGFLILEDTPYRALRYTGEDVPTIYSLCKTHVIHLGSFSKILAPGLRLGWAAGPQEIMDRIALLKMSADTQSSTINQLAVVQYLRDNDLQAHIKGLIAAYGRKRDVMLRTLERCFPSSVKWTIPEGGLFLWLTFPENFDTTVFMSEHALPFARVAFVPGATFFATKDKRNCARLAFSQVSEDKIEQGIERLGELLGSWRW